MHRTGVPAIDEALAGGDRILELGAGRETTDAPNVVRTDAFVYELGSLDVVADAHSLPFRDGSFDFVFSLAVFEHLHSPWIAIREIACYALCAFMQTLHGFPDHYFNATVSGLRHLFADDFTVESCGPSRFRPHSEFSSCRCTACARWPTPSQPHEASACAHGGARTPASRAQHREPPVPAAGRPDAGGAWCLRALAPECSSSGNRRAAALSAM